MSNWYSLEVGNGVEALPKTTEIQETFRKMYIASNTPKDMGVYSKHDLEQNLVTIYFTPSAQPIAEIFGAQPCDRPTKDRLCFIAGPGTCLDFYPVGSRR